MCQKRSMLRVSFQIRNHLAKYFKKYRVFFCKLTTYVVIAKCLKYLSSTR